MSESLQRLAEAFALDEYLSEYPQNKTYQQVLDLVRKEDVRAQVSGDYEDFPGRPLVEMIESTKNSFLRYTKDLQAIDVDAK
jgi:hypothetical protein